MNLLSRVISLAREGWEPVFGSRPTLNRAVEHLVAGVSTMGRRTISRTISALGRDHQDWSADYKLFSRSCWQPNGLFGVILSHGLSLTGQGPVPIALDDTKLKKVGRSIPQAGWHRDPLSPPFHTNLQWGLRYLQASLLVPHDPVSQTGCRSLPIRFMPAPWVKKPGKKASDEDRAIYRKQKKERNLSRTGCELLIDLRRELDQAGAQSRLLIAAVDGSFCNRALFSEPLDRTRLLARARKDARLCFPAPPGSHRTYSQERFTPEQVRQDDSIAWADATIFYAGQLRSIRYKQVSHVLWQRGSGKRPLRLFVIAPQPYKAPSGRAYRDPAYLLTDDLETPTPLLIQIYFDRWQIEVNHREEKSFIGVGDAQLWSELGASRHPTFQIACYSLILLAGILEFGTTRNEFYTLLPKWRKPSARPSILDLLTNIRLDLCNETCASLGISPFSSQTFVLSAFT
jgi:DDE superfamily endonuclease